MQGTTGNISVAGMLRLLSSYRRTGIMNVQGQDKNGTIYLRNGDIVDCKIDKNDVTDKREAVIQLLLVLEEGAFYFEEMDVSQQDSLGICVEDVILESARHIREGTVKIDNIEDFLVPENEVMKISNMHAGHEINLKIQSEEWNMLLKFSGDSSMRNVLADMGVEAKRAKIVIYGLVSAGFLRRTRFKIPEIAQIAKDDMGNIGVAIIDSAFSKLNIDKKRMGMREFLGLLNELENSFAEIIGKTKSKALIEKIWNKTK